MNRSCQRNGRILFLPCGKKPECPEKRTTASLLGTDKPEQAALRLEGYTASSARLNVHRSLSVCVIEQHCSQQEPQMSHVALMLNKVGSEKIPLPQMHLLLRFAVYRDSYLDTNLKIAIYHDTVLRGETHT